MLIPQELQLSQFDGQTGIIERMKTFSPANETI